MNLPSIDGQGGSSVGFEDVRLADLDAMTREAVDALPFGVVGLEADGIATVYNAVEAKRAGISPETVLGTHFFSEVGQCMNNFMVAQRFADEDEIDDVVNYVLTLRMRPTPVRLRLLKGPSVPRHYVLIQR